MPFAICGVTEVPFFANTPLDHIISFREPHQPGPNISGFKHPFSLHSFVCADTGNPDNPHAPTEVMMRRLLDIYSRTRLDQNVLFQCFAGVSRSSAAAFIWLAYHDIPWGTAYEMIVKVRGPFVCPNQLMVRLADQCMERGGEMTAFISAELGRRAPERDKYFASS